MKPSIPDTGTVIRLEGRSAVVRMKSEGSCRKCGAAALGLCKGGMVRELTARNDLNARIGDLVKIGLVQGVQYRGYLLAYVIPAAALVLGAVFGHFLGALTGLPAADSIVGVASLVTASFLSLRGLKRLDSSSAIEIVHVLSDSAAPGPAGGREVTVADHYLSYY